eukprot:TRINITY_DN8555_c0_g1_i2.p1 TRINITY_DN8555_c0_g1~~TRINITY_DN8555_c0_g1_i2.p1  ORF type:complete len:265 (-),score=74.22 TRINITY_DN8555_c0_g1_i2:275-1069(-)
MGDVLDAWGMFGKGKGNGCWGQGGRGKGGWGWGKGGWGKGGWGTGAWGKSNWGNYSQRTSFIKLKGIDADRKVWVGGLPHGTTWKELEEHFVKFSSMKPSFSEIASKGTGVCAFTTAEEATTAIAAMNDTQLKGKTLQVDVWTKKEGGGDDDEKRTLIEQIKEMQRTDAEAKAKWWAFTDEHHGGIHDPRKHDKAVLEQFLLANPYSGGDGKWMLVDQIKKLQRSDADAKAKWWAFTDDHHGGVHDPKKHEKAVLEQFLSAYAS